MDGCKQINNKYFYISYR